MVPIAHSLLCVEAAPQTPRPTPFLAQPSRLADCLHTPGPGSLQSSSGAGEGLEHQGCKLGQSCQQGDEHQSQ